MQKCGMNYVIAAISRAFFKGNCFVVGMKAMIYHFFKQKHY